MGSQYDPRDDDRDRERDRDRDRGRGHERDRYDRDRDRDAEYERDRYYDRGHGSSHQNPSHQSPSHQDPQPHHNPRPPRAEREPMPPREPLPPRGQAPVPDRPLRPRPGRGSEPAAGRREPYDPDPRRPAGIGRATVRPNPEPRTRLRREPVPQDPFDQIEPVTGVARVGEPRASAPGRRVLPWRLAIGPRARLRGRLLPVSFAVVLVLLGSGVIGGSYVFDSVELVGNLTFPETTTIKYSNGAELARLGQQTRFVLPYDHISQTVKDAIVASEDDTFWTNAGIDVGGVARAAWNNFSGGTTQGGSTITQQYARIAYELSDVSYQRKLKEAVLAWKMSQTMEKWKILEAYLNAVPFGRNAYGIEAAVKAFYGENRTADATALPENQITLAEAIALVAMVKQPNPDPRDPVGRPGYDPTLSEAAANNAHNRFGYVRDQLQRMGTITAEQAAELVFPDESFVKDEERDNGRSGPGGHIVNQVLSELTHTPGSPFYGYRDWHDIEDGGYQIVTTIDEDVQAAAVDAASMYEGTGLMSQQKATCDTPTEGRACLQAALVAVRPGTGQVLAYYGGDNGVGTDYAGTYLDENDDVIGSGYHPPGSSFKTYTLAAAMKAGISLNSYWEWVSQSLTDGSGIRNSASCPDTEVDEEDPTKTPPCSLLNSLIASVNVPFYRVTQSVGPAAVLKVARDAGINAMWTNDRERIDLQSMDDSELSSAGFDARVGIGQYPVTVLDHANGMATFAAQGVRANVHFVVKVLKGEEVLWGETLPGADAERIMSVQAMNSTTFAMNQVPAAWGSLGGWPTAGKTGTWELGRNASENAHAWMVGYTRSLAAAVWIGSKDNEDALRQANGTKISGPGLPASVWRAFMQAAIGALDDPTDNRNFGGADPDAGNTLPPGAVPSPTPGFPCFANIPDFPPGCEVQDDEQDGGN